ncbi:Vacuolar protein sorting-associated protein 62 [Physocladia obscura]|uniref:Vacuolar protein sorting-associated protein 62 n=1 Tax=Physocladia obscura TaxID=109957 RepID=A0AAD5XE92_9FUNG|nr:Vacuolar protein sorting-associated protein 62 [Physocladia obscura]
MGLLGNAVACMLPIAVVAQAYSAVSLNRRDYTSLAQTNAPLIVYHPQELYYASSIEYMLPHYANLQNSSGVVQPGAPPVFNVTNLDYLFQEGIDASNLYLSVAGQPKGSPYIPAGYEYLYSSKTIGTTAPIYAFIVPKANDIVDIYYWQFCPYNLGKNAPIVGWTGDHVGDLEYMMVRTINGTAATVDYHAHSNTGSTYLVTDPTVTWSGTHPIVYTANGSHGMWPSVGSHVYKQILGIYDLTDETGNGAQWPTWENVYPINYLENGGYTGDQAWLNFNGYFGNPGDTSCLFYSIVGECEFSGGPNAPNRDFTGPPLYTLASKNTANPNYSVYTFQVAASAQVWAAANGITYVAAHQHCVASPSSESTDNWAFVPIVASAAVTSYNITTARCATDFSRYPSAYEVGLCTSAAQSACVTTSGLRNIKEYVGNSAPTHPDKEIIVNDLDIWTWSY